MQINTKVRYGLRVMIEIGSHHPEGILQKQIAESQDLSLPYLDSIITGLRNSGLIVNFAGKSTGYILARPTYEITVYDVYRAFEPELTLVYCLNSVNDCKRKEYCSTKNYWDKLNNLLVVTLKSTTLDKLIETQNKIIQVI